MLITHGHPDHYNGATNLIGADAIPLVATAGADRVIRENDAAKERQWKPMFGDEGPVRRTFPNRIARDGQTLMFDGVSFTVHDLGPGESHRSSYRNEVAALAKGRASLADHEKGILVNRMRDHLPTDRLEFLIGLGADAVAAELAGPS